MYDLMGKDALLFHHSADEGGSPAAQYVAQARAWFDIVSSSIARDDERR